MARRRVRLRPEIADLSRDVELMRTRLAVALAERERAEQNLRRLFEMAPDAMLGVAQDGSIVMANAQAARTFGYPGQELVGRQAGTLVPEDRRAGLAADTESYFADERSRAEWNATTACGLRADGTTFPVEVRLSRLPTDEGTLTVVAVRDVTERVAMDAERERLRIAAERERLQGRLRQSDRLESLGQLVGGVAHDFNNLLGIISGYSDFAVERLECFAGEDERFQPVLEDMGQVQAAAQQAIRVTRQLLTFAKSKASDREVLDLNEIVASAGELLRRSLGGQIELVIAAEDGLWPVEADRGQLEQVLVNLVVNARDAMPDGGRLSISTANTEVDAEYAGQRPDLKPGRYVRLAVADTGTGMDDETIERVFEPFFSTKPRGRGTGLGLATVYGIVSGLGGTIDVYSEVGLGTTMNMLLPVAGKEAAQVPGPSYPAEEERGHGEAILLVEDEESLRTMTGRILARNGYLVREADGGGAAIRLAGELAEPIDLLVTDMVMPEMLGSEVADQVRALRPGLPALFMTGYAEQVLDFHGIPAPDLDIVQKPFTEGVLLARVRRALDRSGASGGLRRRRAAAALLQGLAVLRHDHLGQLVGGGLGAALVEGDLAVLDHVHPVGHLEHLAVVVRDDDDRDVALCLEPQDEVKDQRALLDPHRGEGLVQEQDLGVGEHRARHRDRLPLTAGQLGDRRVDIRDPHADLV
jgi:PAS domain S-box-containing protein